MKNQIQSLGKSVVLAAVICVVICLLFRLSFYTFAYLFTYMATFLALSGLLKNTEISAGAILAGVLCIAAIGSAVILNAQGAGQGT